jgi:adenosylcobinamide-GDP ribazoletransferase
MKSAFGFLSVIGRRGSVPDTRTSRWFPLVGLVLGAVVGLVLWGAGNMWSPFLAAVVAVIADLGLTGMLHFDGLADAADGLLPHMDRVRRLEVMRAPDVGAFGVGVVVMVLALRIGALASFASFASSVSSASFASVVSSGGSARWHGVAASAALWCASRTAMAGAMWLAPNARPDGSLAQVFGRSPGAMWGVPVALAVAVFADGSWWRGPVAVVAVWLTMAALCDLARRRLGGITGDILGAGALLGETVALVVFVARVA